MRLKARGEDRQIEDFTIPDTLKLADQEQYVDDVRLGLQEMRQGKVRDFAESLREIRMELELNADKYNCR